MRPAASRANYDKPVEDLAAEPLSRLLPARAVRTYPAILSTQSGAVAWAREGAPAGAVVVADYQVSPRGRAETEWQVSPGADLGFSVVVRPDLSADREGWLYTVAACALADVVGDEAAIEWPDEVTVSERRAAVVGIHADLQGQRVRWAVLTILLPGARPPRGPLLARVLEALDARSAAPSSLVLADYTARCATLERRVRARLVPRGASAVVVEGRAAACREDGALLIVTDDSRRIAVRPEALGRVEVVGAASASEPLELESWVDGPDSRGS